MRRSGRLLFALAGLAASLLVSGLLWLYVGQPVLLLVLPFVPFVPFLLRRRGGGRASVRTCPVCGFRTRDPATNYCPRDGTELERNA